jgi:alpha-tubulin suppressor-like RCC1 family protein
VVGEQCNILYPKNEIADVSGCLKEYAHNDHHICRAEDGSLWAWEDDYTCNCGCWDEYEKGDNDVCRVYWEVKTIKD